MEEKRLSVIYAKDLLDQLFPFPGIVLSGKGFHLGCDHYGQLTTIFHIHTTIFIFSFLYIQCNERVKVLYILLCNIFNHMKKYKFQTDPSSEFQTRSSSELVSWDRTYFSKLDPVRNSELGAVWKMLPFQIMLKCNLCKALHPITELVKIIVDRPI